MRSRLTRRGFASALALGIATVVHKSSSAAQPGTVSPAASPAPIAHPTGAADLVLRIDISGGFVPADFLLTAMPGFSLYGDGRLIFLGPQIEIYPPPALPNLRTVRLTEQGIQQVLQEAQQAGLLEGSRTYPENRVADAATTTFTLNAAHTSIVVAAYALGIGNDPDWSDEERVARAKLFAFVQRMAGLPQSLGASMIAEPETAYQIDRLQVVAEPVSTTPSTATPTYAATPIPQPLMDWPLSTPLAASGSPYQGPGTTTNSRCSEIDRADAGTLVSALRAANALTPWRSGGGTYRVLARPLLPDERACRLFSTATPAATPIT
jgi:hypothetical protein